MDAGRKKRPIENEESSENRRKNISRRKKLAKFIKIVPLITDFLSRYSRSTLQHSASDLTTVTMMNPDGSFRSVMSPVLPIGNIALRDLESMENTEIPSVWLRISHDGTSTKQKVMDNIRDINNIGRIFENIIWTGSDTRCADSNCITIGDILTLNSINIIIKLDAINPDCMMSIPETITQKGLYLFFGELCFA